MLNPVPDEAVGAAVSPAAAPLTSLRRKWSGRVVRIATDPLFLHFVKNTGWTAAALVFERLIALAQAFFIARSLGIELFGKYGLMFTTIGLLSSLAGLQLGLTASVHVSRSRRLDPRQAGAVMRLCEIVSITLAGASVAAIAISPAAAASMLLGDAGNADVILPGALIAFFSVLGGVQEGVLQGLEVFARLSVARLASSALGLALLVFLTRAHDLASVVTALALAAVVRAAMLLVLKEAAARKFGLAASLADMWQARGVILSFSIPSVLVSLVSGYVGWYGLFALKGLPGGFHEIAYVTAAQQWRGMVLFGSAILASVAIPMMSRLNGVGDLGAVRKVHRMNLAANLGAASLVVAGVIAASGYILSAYGAAFVQGRLIFAVVMITTVPAVYIIVLQNYFVSHGRMWLQLGYSVMQSLPLLVAYGTIIPRYGAIGFALSTFGVTMLMSLVMYVFVARDMAHQAMGLGQTTG